MRKLIFLSIVLGSLFFLSYGAEYQEFEVEGAKILTGLSLKEALKKYGLPTKVGKSFWYYDYPQNFYLYIPHPDDVENIAIFPFQYKVNVGFPFELKVFAFKKNLDVEEITSYVKWIVNPDNYVKREKNIFIPLKEGNIQIYAIYKDKISNVINVDISKNKGVAKDTVYLWRLYTFPYNPIVERDSFLSFISEGVFVDPISKRVFILDLTHKVDWFVSYTSGGSYRLVKDNEIYFPKEGEAYVFCQYKGIKSDPVKVKVYRVIFDEKEKVKNVLILPDFFIASPGYSINLKAIATYSNNRVEDVTEKVKWRLMGNSGIVRLNRDQKNLTLLNEGIVKLKCYLDGLESFSSKLLIQTTQQPENVWFSAYQVDLKKTIEEVEERIKEITRTEHLFSLNIKKIIVEPQETEIPLGKSMIFKAEAIYSRNKRADITDLAKWSLSNPDVAKLRKNTLISLNKGETFLYATFKGIKSEPSYVKITDPSLVSIILEPKNLRVKLGGAFSIKAIGYFTDKSRRDISDMVEWISSAPEKIEKIRKNVFKAKRLGYFQMYARYGKIRSLPTGIYVLFPWLRLIKLIGKILGIGLIMIVLLLYTLIKIRVNKMKRLLSSPSKFIEEIFSHMKKVLKTFGIDYISSMPPLKYATIVGDKFPSGRDIFLSLTYKFVEAKYSSHVLEEKDALNFLNDYNHFLKSIKSTSRFFIKFIALFLKALPFHI